MLEVPPSCVVLRRNTTKSAPTMQVIAHGVSSADKLFALGHNSHNAGISTVCHPHASRTPRFDANRVPILARQSCGMRIPRGYAK